MKKLVKALMAKQMSAQPVNSELAKSFIALVAAFAMVSAAGSAASAAPTAGSASAQHMICVPQASVQKPHFAVMNLQIARDGQVSGLYRGYQAKAGETLSLQSTGGASGWMELANKPRLTVNSDHNLAVVFDFKGKMGGDEDVFTLVIDPRTGNASLSLAYSNDCGEGDMVQADTQDYTCHLGN